jgi:hypothetical protein
MRVPNAVHESRPWRIREIAPDFTLEDVWALPVYGGAGDFPRLLAVMASRDLSHEAPAITRLMFAVRWQLGRWFGWDDPADRPIPGRNETSLTERLPPDLRGTAAGMTFGSLFAPVYRTDTEFAAETSTSSHAAGSAGRTWRSSPRSGTGSSTRPCSARSNEPGAPAALDSHNAASPVPVCVCRQAWQKCGSRVIVCS